MPRVIPLLLASILGVVLAAALAFAPNPIRNPEQETKVSSNDTVKTSPKNDWQGGAKIGAPFQSASRDVGSGIVASPVEPGTVLERIEPAAAPVKTEEALIANVVLPADAQKRWRVVFNSVITAAGVFDLNGMSIVLSGIDVVSADETCKTNGGRDWPCGTAARTAFRAYVRNRALNCHLPVSRQDKAIVAECLLQGADPAEWLVAQGWARAAAGGPFDGFEKQAIKNSNGIFGSPPAGVGANSGSDQIYKPEALFDEGTTP
jgi:endonuclease YncB( thermonuclease family)